MLRSSCLDNLAEIGREMKRDSWNLALTSGRSLLALQGALCLIACDEPRDRRGYESREVVIHVDSSAEIDVEPGRDNDSSDYAHSWRDSETHLSADSGDDLGPEVDSAVDSTLDASVTAQITDDNSSLFETQLYHVRAEIRYMDRLYNQKGSGGTSLARHLMCSLSSSLKVHSETRR